MDSPPRTQCLATRAPSRSKNCRRLPDSIAQERGCEARAIQRRRAVDEVQRAACPLRLVPRRRRQTDLQMARYWRSEERRGGKEGGSTGSARWSPTHEKKKRQKNKNKK